MKVEELRASDEENEVFLFDLVVFAGNITENKMLVFQTLTSL